MNSRIDVSQTVEIDRPAEIVRRQFADIAHHERTGLHRGVRFEVIDDEADDCRYLQVTKLGPVRLRQEFVLARTPTGPLVNEVVRGQFAGGSVCFDVQPVGGDASSKSPRSVVHARLTAELSGIQALLAPALRRSVARALSRALDEDKRDLERGRYDR